VPHKLKTDAVLFMADQEFQHFINERVSMQSNPTILPICLHQALYWNDYGATEALTLDISAA
jgi:hypothetical protein